MKNILLILILFISFNLYASEKYYFACENGTSISARWKSDLENDDKKPENIKSKIYQVTKKVWDDWRIYKCQGNVIVLDEDKKAKKDKRNLKKSLQQKVNLILWQLLKDQGGHTSEELAIINEELGL